MYTLTQWSAEGHTQGARGSVGHTGAGAVAVMDIKVQDGHTLNAGMPAGHDEEVSGVTANKQMMMHYTLRVRQKT